jgi:GT2 family glycosyltransferase
VALCDDDTWWEPGSLCRAADLLDAHPRIAVLMARILVGPQLYEDPICAKLRASPLAGSNSCPGSLLMGFLAGASMVRRRAFLEAGGFHQRLFIGGEEELLAIDLAVLNWSIHYVDELLVYHYPSTNRHPQHRSRYLVRNRLWVNWLRRPLHRSLRRTMQFVRDVKHDPGAIRAIARALAGLPWILRERRVVPLAIERQLRQLEDGPSNGAGEMNNSCSHITI